MRGGYFSYDCNVDRPLCLLSLPYERCLFFSLSLDNESGSNTEPTLLETRKTKCNSISKIS